MSLRLAALAAALAFALLLPATRSAEAQALDTVTARELDVHERWVVGSINDEREAQGLPRLVISRTLTRAASDYAEYLHARRHFDHTDQEGRSSRDRAMAAGWPNNRVTEVLGRESAWNALDFWVNRSPPHRALLMWSEGGSIGIGHDPQSSYYWVALVASECPAGQEADCELTTDTGDSSLQLDKPSVKKRSPKLRASIRRRGSRLVVRVHALGNSRISICLRRISSRHCVLKRFRMNGPRSRHAIKVRPGRWRAVVRYDGNRRWRGQRRVTRAVRVP